MHIRSLIIVGSLLTASSGAFAQRVIQSDLVYNLPCPPDWMSPDQCGEPLSVIDGPAGGTTLTFEDPGELRLDEPPSNIPRVVIAVLGESVANIRGGHISFYDCCDPGIGIKAENRSKVEVHGGIVEAATAIAATDSAMVNMSGGVIRGDDYGPGILLQERAQAVIAGGEVSTDEVASAVLLRDDSSLRVTGGEVDKIVMENTSKVEILGGTIGDDYFDTKLIVSDSSTAMIRGGNFNIVDHDLASILTIDAGRVDIFGGSFQRGDPIARLRDRSVINLHGGSWPRLLALEGYEAELDVQDRGTLNVFGFGLSLTDAGQGIRQLQGTLSDGAPIDIPVSGNVVLHEVVPLQPGDANQDLSFDQLDIVQVLQGAKYLSGQPATWGEGDWNGGPGGSVGFPPAGNGFFDQTDVVAALSAGVYLKGSYAAVGPEGERGDQQTSVGYHAATGEVWVDAPAGTELTSINIDSASGIFTGDAAVNLGGSFDNDADNNIFKATFGSSFGSLSFGNVAQRGLSEDFLLGDLSVIGSLAGGGGPGDVDLIYVPEPSGGEPLVVAALALALWCRRVANVRGVFSIASKNQAGKRGSGLQNSIFAAIRFSIREPLFPRKLNSASLTPTPGTLAFKRIPSENVNAVRRTSRRVVQFVGFQGIERMRERTMQQATFSQWSLQELETTFHLTRHRELAALTEWLEFDAEISPAEQSRLETIRELVLDEETYWAEEELKSKLIAPLIEMADYRNGMKFFAGRVLSGQVDDYELRGIVDGILAAGHYEPVTPFFCLHEYKPEESSRRNDPAARVLSAMLAARACNGPEEPVYGAYVLGRFWFFLVLKDRDFAISTDYSSARDQIFDVLRALKSLKQLVKPITA